MKYIEKIKILFNMDSERFNTFVGFCTILGGLVSILSFFGINPRNTDSVFGKVCIWINSYIWQIIIILVFSFLFLIALKYRSSAINKMNVTSKGFLHILDMTRELCENLNDIQFVSKHCNVNVCTALNRANRYNTDSLFSKYTIDFLNEVKRIMEGYTECEVSACIKLVVPGKNDKVITFARDTLSDEKRSYNSKSEPVPIKDNSDFYDIINEGTYSYFYVPNLKKYKVAIDNVSDGHHKYKNTSIDWPDHYLGTMVVPIGELQKNKYQVIGFLCLDSLNSKAFAMKQKDINIKLAKSFSNIYGIAVNEYKAMEMKSEDKMTNKSSTINKSKKSRSAKNKKIRGKRNV